MRSMELIRYASIPLELNGKAGDEVMILADSRTEPGVYESFAAAAFGMGMSPNVILMAARAAHGHEPTRVAARGMLDADLLLSVASTAMTHTDAVRAALGEGVRYVSMPGITVDMMTNGAATADYREVSRVSEAVAHILTQGQELHLTCAHGSDLTLGISGRRAFPLDGKYRPGAVAAFPDGEVAMAVMEGTSRGRVIFDLTMHMLGRLNEPVVLTVKDGRAVKIEGGRQAERLSEIFATQGDENSNNIGEFAVGTNAWARAIGNASEDKKRIGTVHIGLGDNCTLSGRVRSATHLDGIMAAPTLTVDGRTIIDAGKLMID
ncbi:MAG: aminopeptidase [Deltaproteobacteria bacterium]|nr:aminopeptidase [Deltaproteobacteria bacterium]